MPNGGYYPELGDVSAWDVIVAECKYGWLKYGLNYTKGCTAYKDYPLFDRTRAFEHLFFHLEMEHDVPEDEAVEILSFLRVDAHVFCGRCRKEIKKSCNEDAYQMIVTCWTCLQKDKEIAKQETKRTNELNRQFVEMLVLAGMVRKEEE